LGVFVFFSFFFFFVRDGDGATASVSLYGNETEIGTNVDIFESIDIETAL
jgi:hypothetical protein